VLEPAPLRAALVEAARSVIDLYSGEEAVPAWHAADR
jgi:hypothetical protein